MPQVDLRLGASPLFALLAIGVAAFLAYRYYRTTLPPISGTRRWILLVLRGTTLALLLLLFLEPVVSIVSSSSHPPVLTVLIDNSKSLSLTDQQGPRPAVVRSVLDAPVFKSLAGRAELRYAAFGVSARPLAAESLAALTFTEDGTDLSAALHMNLAGPGATKPNAILVISDGVSTIGQNPVYGAEGLGAPVYTIGIGEAAEQRDVAITRVSTNAVVYSGVPTPVDVIVKGAGFSGQKLEVTLSDQSTILDHKPLLLQEGTREYAVPLSYVPEGAGVRSYTVSVSALQGELTAKNNRQAFTTRIRKSKLRILLIAGSPSPDVAIMRQTLNEVDQFTISSFTQNSSGGFYEGSLHSGIVDSADCIFLLGYPTSTTVSSVSDMLFSSATARHTPLFVQISKSTDLSRLGEWTALLPFSIEGAGGGEYEVTAEATAAERLTPVLTPEYGDGGDPWGQLPPLFSMRLPLRARPDAAVLAVTRAKGRAAQIPLIFSRRINRQRVLTVVLHGLWRWRLMAQRSSSTEKFFSAFLSNAVHWLTASDAEGPVIARPQKESYAQGEPLAFSAEVYDSRQRPVNDAEVRVVVQRGQQILEGLLLPKGNGRYEGETPGLHSDGAVRYRVTATKAGVVSGSDSGSVHVSGTAIEFLNTRMDEEVLRQLAARTGGAFLLPESTGQLDSLLSAQQSFSPHTTTSAFELQFRNWPWYVALIVLLLAAEWTLRKRSGMI